MMNKTTYSRAHNTATATSAVGIALLICSFTAFAEDNKAVDTDEKWFVGTPLTEVTPKSPINESQDNTSLSVTNVAVDDSRSGWKFNVEYDLSEHFAIGAAYVDMNDVELDINNMGSSTEQQLFVPGKMVIPNSTDGFTVESIYHYNVSDNIGLSGSIGLYNWAGDVKAQPLNINNINKQGTVEGGTDVYFGLGGGYQLTEDMTLEVNWERYQLDDDATEMWSIGVNYHFK